MEKNMTALISLFARYYHTKNSNIKIYSDTYAEQLLSNEEIINISKNMEEGIKFFNSNYKKDNPLKWIVNNNLAPQILARSIFNKNHLLNDIKLGLKQYVIMACGYDTSAYLVNKSINVYELDKPDMIEDKIRRIQKSNLEKKNITYIKCDFNNNWIENLLDTTYDTSKKTYVSLLGISYYLDEDIFFNTIKLLSKNIPSGSSIIFDYPNEIETSREIINKKLAHGAMCDMKSNYTYESICKCASDNGLLIYEHLNSDDINKYYFYDYNTLNPDNRIYAPKGVSYCLMVKR